MEQIIVIIFIILTFLLYGIYFYIQNTQFNYREIYNFPKKVPKTKKIPKIIIQTYHDKSKIPDKVYMNIKKYAPGYKHLIYDDNDCIKFLEKFDNTFPKKKGFNLVDRFKSYKKGAHKADLFRYCFLYMNGGIYIDIKTELIKPIDELFKEDNTLYTVIALNKNSIYQGVIGVYPYHPIFKNLINQCISCSHLVILQNYHIFVEFFYQELLAKSSGYVLNPGKQKSMEKYNIHLFQEDYRHMSECGTPDKYGFCVFIHDKNGRKIIKTRYSDFPWK